MINAKVEIIGTGTKICAAFQAQVEGSGEEIFAELLTMIAGLLSNVRDQDKKLAEVIMHYIAELDYEELKGITDIATSIMYMEDDDDASN